MQAVRYFTRWTHAVPPGQAPGSWGCCSIPGNFSGGAHSTPWKMIDMLFYINNDDKLCFFYESGRQLMACIFHFFHIFLVKLFFTTNNNFKSPQWHLCIWQKWHNYTCIHLTRRAFGQCGLVHGPVAKNEIWANHWAWNETKRGGGAENFMKKNCLTSVARGGGGGQGANCPPPHNVFFWSVQSWKPTSM